MNGAHDLGGMHGFGAINAEPEATAPVFHADWERRVFGMVRAAGALGKWTSDMSRHARERQHPVDYLRHTYYENWLAGLEKQLLESGLLTAEELRTHKAGGKADDATRQRVLTTSDVPRVLVQGSPATLPAEGPPRFQPGQRVRAFNRHPPGHTRAPRYVRGRTGTIHEHRGAHVLPDLSAQGIRAGHHLYSVRFEAAELWGDSAARDCVYVDLWEDYLEPAG